MPNSQRLCKIHRVICKGLTLAPTAGVLESSIKGLTTRSMISTPLWMVGVVFIPIFKGIVSLLGSRLRALSTVKGHRRRTATTAHRRTGSHLGAFFRSKRSKSTAKMIQLAEMLMFRMVRKSLFTKILLSVLGRSWPVPHQCPPRTVCGAW